MTEEKNYLVDEVGKPVYLCMKHGHTTHALTFNLPGTQKTFCMECLGSWITKNFDAITPVEVPNGSKAD